MRRSSADRLAIAVPLLVLVAMSFGSAAAAQQLPDVAAPTADVAADRGHYCDAKPYGYHVAMTRIGLEGRIITKIGVENDQATIRVPRKLWANADTAQRIGIAASVSCAVAGEGKVLRELMVRDESGKPLARWDGLHGGFDD